MEIILLLISLLLSAFFSSSETAYVSSNRLRFELKKQKTKGSDPSMFLLSNAQRYLTATLVGNNIVNVTCSTLVVALFASSVPETYLIILTTTALLIFGEILPKSIAQLIPNKLVRITAPLLFAAYIVFYPLIKIAEIMSQFAVNFFKGEQFAVNNFFKKDDIPILVREFISTKILSAQERDILNRAVKIGDMRISEIMLHRTDIEGIEIGTPIYKVKKIFMETQYSRLPVYKDDLDEIVGFLYYKDLLNTETDIEKLLQPALFFPKTVRAIKALNRLRKEGKSAAIVIDEHGGTAGLLTVEDIIEQLFGSIDDEYDIHVKHIQDYKKTTIIISGRTEISELDDRLQLKLPKGDYITIGGLIENELGYIPAPGEELEINGYKIIVNKAEPARIVEVIIKKLT